MAFHQAARNVLIDDESLLQRFHLGVQFKGTEKSNFFVSFLHAFSQRISYERPHIYQAHWWINDYQCGFFFYHDFSIFFVEIFPLYL